MDSSSRNDSGDGRDNRGRFAPGNAGGPGRLSRATEAEYLCALREIVPPDRWRRIVERAAEDAEHGDPAVAAKAREWIGKYVLPVDVAAVAVRLERPGREWAGRPFEEVLAKLEQGMKDRLAVRAGVPRIVDGGDCADAPFGR